ncbi:unnamed protein product [Danaus chrysippus]|uniref:unspecific monooxygenase n=1 Tax=Danaus chrysippus TaxID=151541 RepID=A0A8J2QNJ2_9NEOP|nr:unnamed protein product [Danaus chrysippus]
MESNKELLGSTRSTVLTTEYIFREPNFYSKEECGKSCGVWMREMYEQFKSPYIGIWLIWKPALIINDPDIARRILVKDSAIFRDRYLSSGSSDPIGGLNLFTVNDPVWTSVRRKLSNTFTVAKLKALHHYTLSKVDDLIRRIERDCEKGLELKRLFVDYTTDVTGTFAFGIESNATLTSKGPLREITADFGKFSIYRGICWFSIFFWPELVDIFRFKMFPKKSMYYFKRIFETVLSRRSNDKGGKDFKDVVDALIEFKKEKEQNDEDVSNEFLIAQAAILLFGGFDTTSSNLTYMTYELAFNSECQEKLYNELKEADERNGGNFDANTVSELTYLNCVLKECLRKYPPMGYLDRIAATDYEIDDKLTIKAGTVVYANAVGLHYDPKYFPEPTKFNPDRFLPENVNKIEPYTFLPFGDGPRVCIGQRFAILTARTAASQLFLRYKVRPLPNTPAPNDAKIDCKGLLLHPGEPMRVEFIPREKK